MLASIGVLCATPALSTASPTHNTGIVYCVNGEVNTFNPQLASGGVVIDTLSAQLSIVC